MKISDIRVFNPSFDYHIGWQTLVEVCTDEGICGYAMIPLGQPLARAIITELFPMCRYHEALEVEPLCNQLRAHWSECGTVGCVISAIEQALWDIRGHFLEMPVMSLIGGKQRNFTNACINMVLDCNESIYQRGDALKLKNCKAIRLCLLDAEKHSARGIENLLMQAIQTHDKGARLIVSGIGTQCVSLKWAQRTAALLEDMGLEHFEVNFPARDISSFQRLSNTTSLSIGMVKGPTSREEGRALITAKAVDYISIDSMRCGGFGTAVWLMHTAISFGIQPVLRGAHDPFSMAADLHLSCLLEDENAWVDYSPCMKPNCCLCSDLEMDDQGRLPISACGGFGVHPRDELFVSEDREAVY